MTTNWYQDFFHGLALELWRKAVSPEQTRGDVDFLEGVFGQHPGGRLLDVPCGNGRHAIELARRGYALTGVDLAEEFIQEARDRAAQADLDIEWILGDMRELPWASEFEGAFCFGNSFGYLDPDGMQAFVAAVSRALKPGGHFCIDTGMAAESILPNLEEHKRWQIEDITMEVENHYRASESCLETRYCFVRDGKTETGTSLHWAFTVREIQSLLAAAGLVTQSLQSSPDGEPFRLGCQRLLLVAARS